MDKIKIIIMGAAGRDFHNFNTYYRDNELYQVVAFTATQIRILRAVFIRRNWLEVCTRLVFRFMMKASWKALSKSIM